MENNRYAGKKCFVIMPFGKKTVDGRELDFDYVYHELIEKAVRELGVDCERCDEILGTGSIYKKMFRGIFDADVSVVDITSQNPNVFYELGIRHALHKHVTLVIGRSDNLQKIPFNIHGISILGYDIDSSAQLETSRKKIRDLIQNGLEKRSPDSIVHEALDDLRVERRSRNIETREEKLYPLLHFPGRQIGYITGNIKNIKNMDVWVNSENTNMQMARHFEHSISSAIRYGGARKDRTGYVIDDLIADDLRDAVRGRDSLPPATIIDTTAGELERTNGVKRIFHAASVIGQPGVGYMPIHNIADCIRNSLELADSQELEGTGIQSILFPLMGTGTKRMSAQDTADQLIDAAVSYFEDNPDSRVNKVCFLAFTEQDREICRHKFFTDPRIATPGETEPPPL